MKAALTRLARELGFSAIGFTNAEIDEHLRVVLMQAGERDVERRVNPFLILPEAQSIIVLLTSYYTGLTGNIASYAFGRDYHRVMLEGCRVLEELLKSKGYQAKAFCDTGDLCDRWLAYRAGLGFFGKNHFLIHPQFGTYTFIAHIVTDCLLKPDKPMERTCDGCGACIRACPGHVLGGASFARSRCLSDITQRKGALTAEEEQLIRDSGCAWGCEICQQVCPHNRGLQPTGNPAFCADLITELYLEEGISQREFKRRYGDRAFSWRGKQPLLRNLKLLEKD